MYSVAINMLFGDRGKFIGMVIGITFASLIMTQQPSILVGLLTRTYAFIQDLSTPDIWVMDPGVEYIEENKPMRETELERVRGVEGVDWAAPLYKSMIPAKLPDGTTKIIGINGVDDATLIGIPNKFTDGNRESLRQSDGIVIDVEAANNRLKVKNPDGTMRPLKVGDELEMNDKRAIVVGLVKVSRNFVVVPQAYTTFSRAKEFSPSTRRNLSYVLVKIKNGMDVQVIADKISKQTDLLALTSQQFKDKTLNYWMKNTGIPINFGISVTLGFLVGAAIAGQTFFSFVRETSKQYAALKAMGLRTWVLVRMVLMQALIVGFIGYGIGVGLTTLFGYKMRDSVLAFRMTPEVLIFSFSGVLLIVLLSAMFAIRQVIKVDPATVFRS
jgi:putative ABC transport system permease protein